MNQCNFIGNLARDPESRFTQSGDQVVNFTIACSEKWKDKSGQQQERTEWVRITVWGKLAEICGQYLHKGSKVFITGKMKTDKYTDQNGVEKYTTSIVAREVEFLSPRQDNGQQTPQQQDTGYQQPPPNTGGDVPF